MRTHVADELRRLKSDFGDRRRTQIVDASKSRRTKGALTAGDVLEDKETWVVVTESGLISRTPTARLPRLSGKDAPVIVAGARSRDILYLFAADGRCAATQVHRLPESEDPARGSSAGGATPLPPGVRPVAAAVLPADRGDLALGFLIFGTTQGVVKKTPLDALPGPSARPFTAIKLGAGDSLARVRRSTGADEVVLASSSAMIIRFPEEEIRPVGLSAAGVMGIRLEKKERLVALEIARPGGELLALSDGGAAKRVPLEQFSVQGRAGKGVRVYKTGVGLAGALIGQGDDHAIAHLARAGARSLRFSDAPRRSRAANGARLVEVKAKDQLVTLSGATARPELAYGSKEPAGKGRKVNGRRRA
jgi:DNA gyrase subunit A